MNTVITTAEGIGLGALGIGMPDIVIWVGVLLHGIYETALKYGFEYETSAEKMFVLKLIEASMMNSENWEDLDAELDEHVRQDVHEIPDEIMVRAQIEKTADALAMEMLVAKFIQGLPVAGVLGGVANPVYYQKIMRYVQMKYWKRYLLRKDKMERP